MHGATVDFSNLVYSVWLQYNLQRLAVEFIYVLITVHKLKETLRRKQV